MIINTMKTIEETRGKINAMYDMYQPNVADIANNNTDKYKMIMDGFVFGYAQGMKAAKAEMKKGGIV